MDASRVARLRDALAGTEWPRATREFGRALRRAVRRGGGDLLLVGTAAYEPWHLAAHLDEEAAWSGAPELSPVLVRHRVPPGARPHLAVGLGRLGAVRRGETLLVVAPGPLGGGFLERLADTRRAGATMLALDASGTPDLCGLAHEALPVRDRDAAGIGLDAVQHLVAADAAATRRTLADRLLPPPHRW